MQWGKRETERKRDCGAVSVRQTEMDGVREREVRV